MGRKKRTAQKQRKDARGYARGGPAAPPPPPGGPPPKPRGSRSSSSSSAPASRSKAPSVSAAAHDAMRDLLERFDGARIGERPAPAASSPPSDRFATRLANVVDRLDGLGFAEGQVESAVLALGYGVTLELALDWLCLHLPTLELPALFTDGELKRDLGTETTAESLAVVTGEAGSPGSDEGNANLQSENILSVEATTSKRDGATDGSGSARGEAARREQEEQKQRLLRQYEYEHDGEEDCGDNGASASTPQESDDSTPASLSPDERRLKEQESTLAELEADLNNDANNYMRSKAEIKQLSNEAKKMRQKVSGLRRKVERAKAEEQRRREKENKEKEGVSAAEAEETAEDCGGGMFDLFGKGDDGDGGDGPEEPAPAKEAAPVAPPKSLDFRIPPSWTGATPTLMLEDYLKKHKLPRARYNKLPKNGGYVLAVTTDREEPPSKWEARSVDFVTGSSIRDYLAAEALYGINPTVQLHRVFPGPFRDLWLSWTNAKEEEKETARKVVDDAKRERVDRLMALIAEATKDAEPATKTDALADLQNGQLQNGEEGDLADDPKEGEVLDNWDDESDDDVPARPSDYTPSLKGKKLQTKFSQRQSTPSYHRMKAVRDDLPMAAYRSQVLESVENNAVTILCAETGAGKSTQCPQYLLEQALLDGRGDSANIICTQPRRVAATSLAERVSEEMCDALGGLVGYQIRMESRRSANTRLLFCTTGVVLRRIRDDPTLEGVTHVICDEVHERSQQIDVLLIVLRRMLGTTRPDLKVVLMSATMETELFTSFFQGAPTINVPGRTFPVSSYFLEDLLEATSHVIEEGSRCAFRESYHGETASLWVTTRGGEKRRETVDLTSQVTPAGVSDRYAGYSMSTRRSMERVNESIINYDLIEDVLKVITGQTGDSGDVFTAPDGADMSQGSILIFLPGLGEIRALIDRLDGSRIFRDRQRFDPIPLHSTLSSRDQRRAFVPARPGCRKIICATNIAETSVTIADVVYVIDTGRTKEVRQNKRTGTSMLVADWCPKSSAKQRQGRAGRVQSGICLKLYSSATAEQVMKAVNEPELRRVPLEEICMSILASGFATSCMDFLDEAPQPPSEESVRAAVDVLYDVGAIERTSGGDERLTPLGFHLSKLPVDVKCGKMLIFGALFRCIEPILTIAASLSSKSPFAQYMSDAAVAKAKQRVFSDPDSDFMTYCNVWEAYESSATSSRRFCHENYLNPVALREIGDARRQFLELLCGIGFLDRAIVVGNGSISDSKVLKSSRFNRNASKKEVIHAVICAGLYPNVLRLEQSPSMNLSMWHKSERIYFHGASVNASKKRFSSSENWVVFHEKFGTPSRTSVSTTAFVHPYALLLFGGSVLVKHADRMVTIDDWMNIGMSAQTGVILRELRNKLDGVLQRMIKDANNHKREQLESGIIDGFIKILVL